MHQIVDSHELSKVQVLAKTTFIIATDQHDINRVSCRTVALQFYSMISCDGGLQIYGPPSQLFKTGEPQLCS